MNKVKIFLLTISLFFGISLINNSHAQKLSSLEKSHFENLEDSLVVLADSMLRTPLHTDRKEYGFKFANLLKHTLELENSFLYPFEKLGKTIHVVQPDDKKFRIFNWLVAPAENMRRYYGVIQTATSIFPLHDNSKDLSPQIFSQTLDRKQWYGNEIYKLQTFKKGKETFYLWYGLNTDGIYTNKKSLDALFFKDGVPYFGLPIFEYKDIESDNYKLYYRLIWEYSKVTGFTLNYDEERDMILFDRLQSVVNKAERKNTYAPSGQTEGLKWKRDYFEYLEEAIPILQLEDGGAPVDGVFPKR